LDANLWGSCLKDRLAEIFLGLGACASFQHEAYYVCALKKATLWSEVFQLQFRLSLLLKVLFWLLYILFSVASGFLMLC